MTFLARLHSNLRPLREKCSCTPVRKRPELEVTECTPTLHYRGQRHMKHQRTHSNKITPTHGSSPGPDAVNCVYRDAWRHCFMLGETFDLNTFLHHLSRWTLLTNHNCLQYIFIFQSRVQFSPWLSGPSEKPAHSLSAGRYTSCTRQPPRISSSFTTRVHQHSAACRRPT